MCFPLPLLCCAPEPPLIVLVVADEVAPTSRVRPRAFVPALALACTFCFERGAVAVLALVEIPARVLVVVLVVCDAVVLWFVVAFGLIVTLLCGIALNRASVVTDVLALGLTLWRERVVVVLVAVPEVPACVLVAVFVDCDALVL